MDSCAHHRTSTVRPWITKAAAMIGLPPTRSATMGVRNRLPMLHTERD